EVLVVQALFIHDSSVTWCASLVFRGDWLTYGNCLSRDTLFPLTSFSGQRGLSCRSLAALYRDAQGYVGRILFRHYLYGTEKQKSIAPPKRSDRSIQDVSIVVTSR